MRRILSSVALSLGLCWPLSDSAAETTPPADPEATKPSSSSDAADQAAPASPSDLTSNEAAADAEPTTKKAANPEAALLWRHDNPETAGKRERWTKHFIDRNGRLPTILETPWWENPREIQGNRRARGLNGYSLSMIGLSIETLSAIIADPGATAATVRAARTQRAKLHQSTNTQRGYEQALRDYRQAGQPGMSIKILAESAPLKIKSKVTGTLTAGDVALVSTSHSFTGRLWFYVKSVNGDADVCGWLDAKQIGGSLTGSTATLAAESGKPATSVKPPRPNSTNDRTPSRQDWQRGTPQTLELRLPPKRSGPGFSGARNRSLWWFKSDNRPTPTDTPRETDAETKE